jgi:hypothetical protein
MATRLETRTELLETRTEREPRQHDVPNGGVVAALVSAGIACAALGLCVVLAAASPTVNDLMNWYKPAGPLTGKTTVPAVLYLLAWPLLHLRLRHRHVKVRRSLLLTLALVGLGLLGTFPPVYNLFHHGP